MSQFIEWKMSVLILIADGVVPFFCDWKTHLSRGNLFPLADQRAYLRNYRRVYLFCRRRSGPHFLWTLVPNRLIILIRLRKPNDLTWKKIASGKNSHNQNKIFWGIYFSEISMKLNFSQTTFVHMLDPKYFLCKVHNK